jgi:arabinan endo-1,5-alpha-L-arabinosidase
VVSNGAVKIYLNGQVVFSGSNFPNVFGTSGTKGFGLGVNFWDTPFKGMLDEVQIYGEAISAEDVLQLYQQSMVP